MGFSIRNFIIRIGQWISGGTSGSVLYVDSSGNLAQENANLFYDATNNRLGIDTATPQAALDISYGGVTHVSGADESAATRTNNTAKKTRIGCVHYANAEEPVAMIFVDANLAANILRFGGGTALFNAATQIEFYTAATTTTQTGTARMTIDFAGNVAIGPASANANAILDLQSTTKAFMPPRMTEAQRDAIASPTAGMVVYNTTTNLLNFYNGAAWGAV